MWVLALVVVFAAFTPVSRCTAAPFIGGDGGGGSRTTLRRHLNGGAAAGNSERASDALHEFLVEAVKQTHPSSSSGSSSNSSNMSEALLPALVYVAGLPLLSSAVGYGRLGLDGDLGFEGGRVRAKGVPYAHAVSMHTFNSPMYSHATFDLGVPPSGGFTRTLRASVAINDKNNFFGRAGSSVVFVALAIAADASSLPTVRARACMFGAGVGRRISARARSCTSQVACVFLAVRC